MRSRWYSIGTIFKGNTEITAFKELVHFTRVTSLASQAFAVCSNLKSLHMPNSITTMAYGICRACSSLEDVVISTAITEITQAAFNACAIKHLVLHEGLVKIKTDYAFGNCTQLLDVTFPSTITDIGTDSFRGCTALTEMIFNGTTPPTLGGGNNILGPTSATWPIYVPDSAVDAYKAASSWALYKNRVKGISERPS